MDTANTAMNNMHIPDTIQDEVREFMIYIQATQDQQEELQKFLQMISPSLKQKVAICIFTKVL